MTALVGLYLSKKRLRKRARARERERGGKRGNRIEGGITEFNLIRVRISWLE